MMKISEKAKKEKEFRGWIFKRMKEIKTVSRPRGNGYNHNNKNFGLVLEKGLKLHSTGQDS